MIGQEGHLELVLVDGLVLQPAQQDLHHVVPVRLELQQLAANENLEKKIKVLVRFCQPADALLQPGDELEDEVLRLHLEAWQGVWLVVVVEEVHLLLLLERFLPRCC